MKIFQCLNLVQTQKVFVNIFTMEFFGMEDLNNLEISKIMFQ